MSVLSKSARRARWPLTQEERFWSHVVVGETDDACWSWTAGTDDYGYGRITFDGCQQGAHRVSWQIHVGPIPDDLCVLHHCDNPPCCNPRHLWLGTRTDNADDKTAKGRAYNGVRPRGVEHAHAKLNDKKVREIRRAHAAGESSESIARRLGVVRGTVGFVLSGATWRHVQ